MASRSNFKENYSLRDLEFKTQVYYGQASLDFRRKQGKEGLSDTLRVLSNQLEKYLAVMKRPFLILLFQGKSLHNIIQRNF